MKKELILFVLGLILLPSILAVDINLVKNSYNGMETLQADITGNFISLGTENVFIYEAGGAHSEAVLSGLIKRGKKYHFYAVLPNRAGNFSLRIEGVQYIKSGELIEDVINKNFKIIMTNGTVLSVNPGFIVAVEEEISINVMSFNGNMEASASLGGESKSVSLVDSISEEIKFSVLGIGESETILNVGEYNIPVFLLKPQEVIENITKINVIPVDLIGILDPEKDYTFKLVLENIGETNISEVSLSSDLEVLIEPDSIGLLGVGEKTVVDVTILKVGDVEEVSGELSIKFGEGILNLPLSFKIGTSEEVIVAVEEKTGGTSLNCGDLDGEICLDGKKCDEDTLPSLDGPCCLGKCNEKSSGFNWWAIGLLILVVAGLIFAVYYKKIRKKQVPKSKEEVLNDKSEHFKKRMGLRKGVEVNKRLDKV